MTIKEIKHKFAILKKDIRYAKTSQALDTIENQAERIKESAESDKEKKVAEIQCNKIKRLVRRKKTSYL